MSQLNKKSGRVDRRLFSESEKMDAQKTNQIYQAQTISNYAEYEEVRSAGLLGRRLEAKVSRQGAEKVFETFSLNEYVNGSFTVEYCIATVVSALNYHWCLMSKILTSQKNQS